MNLPKARSSLAVLLGGFLALACAVGATAWLVERQKDALFWQSHTLEVQNRLRAVLSNLQDAETGQRGYLITGLDEYLEPYNDGISHVDKVIADLASAIEDNPQQVARFNELRRIAKERQELLVQTVELYRKGNKLAATALIRAGAGKDLMDRIRGLVAAMLTEEQQLFETRRKVSEAQAVRVSVGLIVSAALVIIIGLFVLENSRRRLNDLVSQRDALSVANEQLKAAAEHRDRIEDQLRQMQKVEAIGQLSGGIAHDFNNVLAIIIGSLALAKRRMDGDLSKARELVDNAVNAAQRAAQLTSRLLAFARQQALQPKACDVNKLVGSITELLRRTLGEDIQMETVLAGGLWPVFADPDQLQHAVLNLCVNAKDAMPNGGKITIETANFHLDDAYAYENMDVKAGQYAMVSVTDTGSGMPAEVIARAFDPFFTTKSVGKGTGLGLSQVHGFVKQSGGHVKIYSEVGLGSSVKIYLPRHLAPAETVDPGPRAAPIEHRSANNELVLVVEDDDRMRDLSVDTLRELGYRVLAAASGAQALKLLGQHSSVDLLFTDVVMPEMNGRQLAQKVREQFPTVRVLYTTGYSRNAIVHNGVLDADVALLQKPFTIEQLAQKVRQLLDS